MSAARSHFIKDRTEWLAFVEDTADGHGSRTHVTAIEFILQPFAYEKMYIPRGSRHEVVVPITKDEQFLVWKFELEDYDVDFSVQFVPSPLEQPVELVHSQTRYLSTSAGRPVEGRCAAPRAERGMPLTNELVQECISAHARAKRRSSGTTRTRGSEGEITCYW